MLFSVIVPAYNAELYITRAVKSVLHQTYTDFELILVNDGSKDKTLEIMKTFKDRRIQVINKENGGVSVARNTGIEDSKGDYICFLDADDEYLPMHLSYLKFLIDKYPLEKFFAPRYCVSKKDNINSIKSIKTSGKIFVYKNFMKEIINNYKLINTDTVCIRREMFAKYGMFEPGVTIGEDTDMWRRIYVHTGIVYGDKVTVKVNRDGSKATKNYMRRYELDPLNRMQMFLNDGSIRDDVKESLKLNHEYSKLEVARSYIYDGKKHIAIKIMKQINKKLIPSKRWMITKLCFFIPSPIIRYVIKFKNRGIYEQR